MFCCLYSKWKIQANQGTVRDLIFWVPRSQRQPRDIASLCLRAWLDIRYFDSLGHDNISRIKRKPQGSNKCIWPLWFSLSIQFAKINPESEHPIIGAPSAFDVLRAWVSKYRNPSSIISCGSHDLPCGAVQDNCSRYLVRIQIATSRQLKKKNMGPALCASLQRKLPFTLGLCLAPVARFARCMALLSNGALGPFTMPLAR